jgi:hypothetical protein
MRPFYSQLGALHNVKSFLLSDVFLYDIIEKYTALVKWYFNTSEGHQLNFHSQSSVGIGCYFRCDFTNYNQKCSVSSEKHNLHRFHVCFTYKYIYYTHGILVFYQGSNSIWSIKLKTFLKTF